MKILDELSKPRLFWKFLGTAGIIVAIFLMVEGVVSLINYGKMLVAGTATMPGLSLLLPSVEPQVEVGPGYVQLPFWLWLIIIPTVIIPHEVFHGIMSRAEKIRVKSTGLLLLLILPGAFVEPDEKQLKKANIVSKLRVFAVGSTANFLVYMILFYSMSFVIWPSLATQSIVLSEVNATGPADRAGLKAGMVITDINGKPLKGTYEEYLNGVNYWGKELSGLKPGDRISLLANGTVFNVVLGANPENRTLPYLGIVFFSIAGGKGAVSSFILELFTWSWIISYAVSIFNVMPIYPLDGGLIVHAIAEKVNKKYANRITYTITAIMIFILAFNFFVPFLLKATLPPS